MGIASRIAARVPREFWLRPAAEIWETEHRLMHALGRARPPAAVQWMVTRSCDLHCGHCYAEAGRRAHHELTTDEARELVIDAVADMGCPLLVLAGGELWLRRDIEQLIAHAVARGLEWAMHTHGGHVTKHREFLRRHPPALAAISLDGDAALHDGFRGKPGSHAAALAAVRVLVEAGCREVVLGTTVTRHNADAIADMFPEVVRSGAHSWGLHLVAPEGRADVELLPRPDQLRRLAAFARARRAVFPVELCNEWGSAGPDDAFYRDRPFSCGAGRISMVVDPSGEVMPCTTTDPRESEGNVRETPLAQVWREGFGRFRTGAGPSADAGECWLQTRHAVRIAVHAFGPLARPQPRLIDYVPTQLVSLGARRLTPRTPTHEYASPLARKAISAGAVALALLGACTLPRESSDADEPTGDEPRDHARASEPKSPPTPAAPASTAWPASLDHAGLLSYGAWSQMSGPWKVQTLPAILAWEQAGAAPRISISRAAEGLDERLYTVFTQALERHLARGFGRSNIADLLELLDAAERVALFDAGFAAHLWRAAEAIATPESDARHIHARANLYARLAAHHQVVLALIASSASLGPISQRAWLKKSAPPPGWRELDVPDGFERSARGLLTAGVSGPWDTVGLSVSFTSTGDAPVLLRNGTRTPSTEGTATRWTRLDVIAFASATRVELAGGLVIDVPADVALTHASLAQLLSDSARRQLDTLIDRALDGDTQAQAELEALLPIARGGLRTRLTDRPDAPGAGALRVSLVGYEE